MSRRSSRQIGQNSPSAKFQQRAQNRTLRLGVGDRHRQSADVVGRQLEEVEGDALRRLRADAGQATELVDEGLNRLRVDRH